MAARTLERYLARQIYAAVGFVLFGFLALFAFFDRAVEEGFVSPTHRAIVLRADTPELLLDRLAAWVPTAAPKWIDRSET